VGTSLERGELTGFVHKLALNNANSGPRA
jgi:hypothetical protein